MRWNALYAVSAFLKVRAEEAHLVRIDPFDIDCAANCFLSFVHKTPGGFASLPVLRGCTRESERAAWTVASLTGIQRKQPLLQCGIIFFATRVNTQYCPERKEIDCLLR